MVCIISCLVCVYLLNLVLLCALLCLLLDSVLYSLVLMCFAWVYLLWLFWLLVVLLGCFDVVACVD